MTGLLLPALLAAVVGAADFSSDTFKTPNGDVTITFVGHGTLFLTWKGLVIHVDPWSRLADYSAMPKADLVLITHHHRDHFDPQAIEQIRKDGTIVVMTQSCSGIKGTIMNNGDTLTAAGVKIEAVPAYNLVHLRDSGEPFHVKGQGNGYLIDFGGFTVYIAGDTENIPEMEALRGRVDVAFLPVNLPYTMDAQMAAAAARAVAPKVFYPYHFSKEEVAKLQKLLKDEPFDLRIRALE